MAPGWENWGPGAAPQWSVIEKMRLTLSAGRFAKPALLCALLLAGAADAGAQDKARGAYLVGILGCGDCHTAGAMTGKPDMARALGGSDVGWDIPGMGVFYGSNLTPDRQAGLGDWTDAQIVTALRTGVRPDGRQLAPVMPYMGYKNMTDADATAIVAYLRGLKPVSGKAPGPFGPGEKPTAPYFTLVVPGK